MEDKIIEVLNGCKLVGVGTGNTVEKCIKYFEKDKTYVYSSYQTMIALHKYNLKTIPFSLVDEVDIYIDGADFFDDMGNLIKGKGGALTTEKLLCSMSKRVLIVVQEYKYREIFEMCYVPVEVIPQSLSYIVGILRNRNIKFSLRTSHNKHGPLITELGNFIIDVEFNLEFLSSCKNICGVVEHGYFGAKDYKIEVFRKEN